MGMSSSQARLLTITSRIHDVEFTAQNIESQKIALATQKDDVYQAYCDALDAKKIQVAYTADNGTRNYIDANYGNVCTYDPAKTQQYAIKDADSGKAIVPDDVYKMYKTYGFSNDKYGFAWAMLGLKDCQTEYDDDKVYYNLEHEFHMLGVNKDETGGLEGSPDGSAVSKLMTSVEQAVYDEVVEEDTHGLEAMYDAFWEADKGENTSEKWKAFNEFRSALYKYYGSKIYDKMKETSGNNTSTEWDEISGEYNYYVHLFEEIENCGGCVSISDFSNGAMTDNDWFNNVVNSGKVLIDMYNSKSGWSETSVATSTNNNYLQQVPDEIKLKKAEAEYEHELDIINQKDKKFDTELNKLETERKALDTESESIKKVIGDNSDRNFGIFS